MLCTGWSGYFLRSKAPSSPTLPLLQRLKAVKVFCKFLCLVRQAQAWRVDGGASWYCAVLCGMQKPKRRTDQCDGFGCCNKDCLVIKLRGGVALVRAGSFPFCWRGSSEEDSLVPRSGTPQMYMGSSGYLAAEGRPGPTRTSFLPAGPKGTTPPSKRLKILIESRLVITGTQICLENLIYVAGQAALARSSIEDTCYERTP